MDHLFWYPGQDLSLPQIVRAENSYLYDRSGNRYLDLESGVWCTIIGHGHPRVLKVLSQQAGSFLHSGFGFGAPVVQETAKTVLDLHGFENGRAVFLCSGSEAVEFGIRTAQAALGETGFLTMADSYFGAYGEARHKRQWTQFDWTGCRTCIHGNCSRSCERLDSLPFDRINVFVFEPGSAAGLVGFPPVHLVRAIAEKIRENNGLVLVNEVTTGMGRTGRWFGYEHYDIRPDVVAMGKGLGNGYPVSATAVSERVCRMLDGGAVAYAQSHQNDPLGSAVAGAVINVIRDQDLIRRSGGLADQLMDGLTDITASTGRVREVRVRGLMAAVELEGSPAYARQVKEKLLAGGYVLGLRPGLSVLRIDPALTVDPEDLEGFIRDLERILAEPACAGSI